MDLWRRFKAWLNAPNPDCDHVPDEPSIGGIDGDLYLWSGGEYWIFRSGAWVRESPDECYKCGVAL